jgi:hypothetical protein
MADEFDAAAAAQELKNLVVSTAAQVAPIASQLHTQPVFKTNTEGHLTDRNGRVIREKVQPLITGTSGG